MNLRLLFLIAAIFLCCSDFAKTKSVEGSSVFYIPSTMTRAQAEEEAIRHAKIDALNKAFGNSMVASNVSISTEKDERFFSNGFDLVKGEWIETVGKPEIKTLLDGDEVYLSVKIKGKAREKKSAEIDIDARILRNGTTANCEASEFRNGDKIYLSLRTPVDGYLCVFQHDPAEDAVYCLLPYRKEGTGSVRVHHDKEYIFFSKIDAENPRMVDEYRLGCEDDADVNTIYVVFSPNTFSRPNSARGDRRTPSNIPFADFEKWKSRSLAQDPSMTIISKNIIINN